MNKRKLLKVICYAIITVSLISLLVIGASADNNDGIALTDNTADGLYPSHELMFEWFYDSLSIQSQNDCTITLLDWYFNEMGTGVGNNPTTLGIFDFIRFYAGRMNGLSSYYGTIQDLYIDGLNGLETDYTIQERIYLDTFFVEFENFYEDTVYTASGQPSYAVGSMDIVYPWLSVSYIHSSTDGDSICIEFYDDEYLRLYFDVIIGVNGMVNYSFDYLVYKNAYYYNTYGANVLSYLDYAFVPRNDVQSSLLSFVSSLLTGNPMSSVSENCYNPKNFYYALIHSYEWLYEQAFDEAYADGWRDGYNEGLYDGEGSDITSNDAYQRGYNDAINDVESGDFGRNFLSGIFTVPLNALRSFTLVEWTTSSGTHIAINLLTIISAVIGLALFIWFLKMFAGG